LNGVGVKRTASGKGSGIDERAGRIGAVVVCVGLGREFEARLEQFVTTAEDIKEAREALIELGKDIARRGSEVELWQAQIAYTQMFAKMGTSTPGDDEVTKEYEGANRRLFSLFEKGWKAEDRLLFRCYWEFKKRLVYRHRAEG
jgi:hypothetical protein